MKIACIFFHVIAMHVVLSVLLLYVHCMGLHVGRRLKSTNHVHT